MRAQKLMFKEMLFQMGVYMPIHITELPDIELLDIPHITNFSEMSSSYNSVLPYYHYPHHTSIIQRESTINYNI